MKIRILLIVIICFSTLIHAQIQPTAEGSISGKVLDKNSKSPISYVNIVLKQENKDLFSIMQFIGYRVIGFFV